MCVCVLSGRGLEWYSFSACFSVLCFLVPHALTLSIFSIGKQKNTRNNQGKSAKHVFVFARHAAPSVSTRDLYVVRNFLISRNSYNSLQGCSLCVCVCVCCVDLPGISTCSRIANLRTSGSFGVFFAKSFFRGERGGATPNKTQEKQNKNAQQNARRDKNKRAPGGRLTRKSRL